MGYRTFEQPPKPAPRYMEHTTTPGKVFIHNGTTANLAIPCWYKEILPPVKMAPHNRPMHDHMGWPYPGHPDASCQLYEPFEAGYPNEPCHTAMGGHPPVRQLLDLSKVIPIHLTDEGYTSAYVLGSWEVNSVQSDAEIDDWTIRLKVAPVVQGLTEPQTYKFSVFVYREEDDVTDLAFLGELVVLPTVDGFPR